MEYKLQEGFEYANKDKGGMETAQFISITPPTARNITDIAPVKCEVMKAVNWAQNQDSVKTVETVETVEDGAEDNEDSKQIDPSSMMQTLELAPNIDVAKVILHVRAMLVGGLGKVDGEFRFTQPLAEDLSLKDVYGITGFFLVNFILPSL